METSRTILMNSKRVGAACHRVFFRNFSRLGTHCRVSDDTICASVAPPLSPRPLSEMPGPAGLAKLPYIGVLFLLHPFSKYKVESYGHMVCSMHDKYGPIFKTRHGKKYTVHTANIEDIETVFKHEPMYPHRRVNTINRLFREERGLPQGLATSNGPEWYSLRKFLNVPLNRPKSCMEYLPAQNKVTDDLLEALEIMQLQGKNSATAVFDLLFRYSSESIATVCFGQRLGFLTEADAHPEIDKLLGAIHTHLNSSFKVLLGKETKFLWNKNDGFYKKYCAAMDFIREQSTKYANETLAAASRDSKCQVTSAEEEADSGNHCLFLKLSTTNEIPFEHILAITESLFIAGTDSTARNLSLLFYNLAMHADAQERLREEIIKVMGRDGPVTPEALAKMSYLKACVKESMRLCSPVAPGVERTLSDDLVLSGYHVPKGTSVLMSSNKTSRNPKFFPEPDTYKPDRWIREDGRKTTETTLPVDPRLAALAFLPFGHGKRSCVGRRFAELEIFICTAKLIQKFSVSVDPEYTELETIYTPFITPLKAIPFKFTRL